VGEKYIMSACIPGKFPVTLFGEKINGRSKFIAVLTREGKDIQVISIGQDDKYTIIDVTENRHDMIVNSMQGINDTLFSVDYSGKVVKSQVIDGKLKLIGSVSTGSGCANSVTVLDENTIYVGSADGSVKRISFS
jgi:hypothetical protein